MNKLVLTLVTLTSMTTLAQVSTIKSLKQTKVADCKLLISGEDAGLMQILLSDNGDEGFLSFNVTSNVGKMTFTDNVQDEGAAFLKKNTSALYISYEGVESKSGFGTLQAAAVHLENKNGKITGKLKADFYTADLVCAAKK